MIKPNSTETGFWNNYKINEWIFFAVVISIGLLLRWMNLTDRPLHHDESLHAIYGLYIYDDPQNGFYKYNALLHGPLLYNILPFIYDLFGTGKWAVRFLPAFLGTFFMFVPFIFRKYFHKNTLFFLVTCIALSPSLVFWSRFLRHDYLAISSMLLVLWGIFCVKEQYAFFPIIVGMVLQFTIKENAFVTTSLLLGYAIFESLFGKLVLKKNKQSIHVIWEKISKHKISFLLALALAMFIYTLLYSAGFKYSQGILDGLYRESLGYWLKQHHIERIAGPFMYQTLVLSWYELYFLIFTIIHMIHFYYKAKGPYLYAIITTLALAVTLHISLGTHLNQITFLYKVLKIKIPIDFYPFLIIVVHAFNLVIFYLKRNDTKKAFWGYLFFGTLFAYSFVGEKVPWLACYPLITGIIFLAIYLEETLILDDILNLRSFKKIPINGLILMAIIILFTLKTSISTNFARSGLSTELISQVHTEKTFEDIILKIKDKVNYPMQENPISILAYNMSWPTSWYFFKHPNYYFISDGSNLSSFDYVIADPHNPVSDPNIQKTHQKINLAFRSWWVPPYETLTWSEFFSYLFTHNPKRGVGSSYFDLYIRK